MDKKQTILIVDDEDDIRENLHDFIEFKGYHVLEAGNGLKALTLLGSEKPDLIVSDLMMPEMGGLEFLQELPKKNIDIPVVIMTAFGTMEYAIDAMKNGAADFLTKPIDLNYMTTVISRVLARNAMEQKVKEQQRQLDDDLRHAAVIQECLLPKPVDTPHLSIQYCYQPFIAIGGDYLTVHRYSERELAVAVYDVSGHGVSAALTANLVHNQLQQRLAEHRPPSNVIHLLNRFITDQIGKTSMFLTIVIAAIDMDEGVMTVTNAGHPDLFLWRNQDKRMDTIGSHVPPVGFSSKILGDKNETTTDLSSGDRIVFYTDGFIEARNTEGTLLSTKGLQAIVEEHACLRPDDFLSNTFDAVTRYHSGDPDDDMTLVVVDIK